VKPAKILIVEDDEATVFGYSKYLSSKGYQVSSVHNLADARKLVINQIYDAILLDVGLPDGCAIDVIPEFHASNENSAIIVISGVSEIRLAVKAIHLGADNYLTKPVNLDDLEVYLKNSLEVSELKRRDTIRKRLAPEMPRTYFNNVSPMRNVMKYAQTAAVNDTVVLVLGETGTGKGVLARWIHEHSARANGNYVELNCSSLKGEILRSELYGHARGAFTSAIKDREGLIEIADGGTLFLDEIGDMDQIVQAELLKTIEERSFRRIGENKIRTSDFRLICATNRDLLEASRAEAFRSDLYYRICVFPIELPALRNRRGDIQGMIKQILVSFGYTQFPIDQAVIDALVGYSWPGNIRELKNMLERALLLSRGNPLSITHFPGLMDKTCLKNLSEPLWNLDTIEKGHIIKAMKHFKEDKHEICKALGISLSSLYRKLEIISNELPG
jgi:DNA-binding NtrC family response regulator